MFFSRLCDIITLTVCLHDMLKISHRFFQHSNVVFFSVWEEEKEEEKYFYISSIAVLYYWQYTYVEL